MRFWNCCLRPQEHGFPFPLCRVRAAYNFGGRSRDKVANFIDKTLYLVTRKEKKQTPEVTSVKSSLPDLFFVARRYRFDERGVGVGAAWVAGSIFFSSTGLPGKRVKKTVPIVSRNTAS